MPSATGMTLARLRHQPLAKRALDVRKAHRAAVEAHVEAMLLDALLAIAASAAGPARAHRHPLADGEAGDAGTEPGDPAADLVTEDHRLLDPHRAETAMLVIVQVGAADAAGFDRDLDLAGSGFGECGGLHAQVLGSVDDDGAHFRMVLVIAGVDCW